MTTKIEPWRQLGDKVVMVTDASSGIGREFCLDLAKSGCRIIAAARRTDRLESLCDEINRLPESSGSTRTRLAPRAVSVELDVSADGAVVEAAVQRSWEGQMLTIGWKFQTYQISGSAKPLLDSSEEEWNSIVKINLTGTWLVSKYVCLRMCDAKKGGSVINISSIGGLNRELVPASVAYCTSKAAINTLTKMMAIELGAHNIRVNSIAPGLFKSEITEGLMQKDWLNNVALRSVPLRTLGTSDPALTSLVRYLIHDSSEYISDNIFIIDAGTTLPGIPIFSSL
ncbi:hypothetical protein Vadar_033459 [Vaccinium darrowii]|uniref:Uncharacterized protein n=1 Tax=Vaccinium darrowii TaxID=229202 RepID=A0ACB7YRZ1_9ERIC|nr:hypothetical protein Vadar_033459 [Vaccinium darrowii]